MRKQRKNHPHVRKTRLVLRGGAGFGRGVRAVAFISRVYRVIGYTRADSSVVTYTYDANGNRITRTEGSQTDTYSYDYENRLLSLNYLTGASDTGLYEYAYDHRTRRVVRDESAVSGRDRSLIVFAGGTSVQEHATSVGTTPEVEYIRGSDYGGGIGGILYTLRSGAPAYNHYNSRGDVVAQTSVAGSLTWQAQYEAFGTRTAEDGANPDRQKANTKDEDPHGLLNEGFRYRDLETGAFITRDPLGFVDGPNVYTYVIQNPWTKFDPLGLFWDPDSGWWGAKQYKTFGKAMFVDPTVDTYKQGSKHMEQGFQAIADGEYVEGALHVTAAVGKAAEVTLDVVSGGKSSQARKGAQESIEMGVDALQGAGRQASRRTDEAVEVATDLNAASRRADVTPSSTCQAFSGKFPNPDPSMDAPPVRYEPKNNAELQRMREGKGLTTKATHGDQNIEAHHKQQVSTLQGGVIDEVTQQHRGAGWHSRHSQPSQLSPS